MLLWCCRYIVIDQKSRLCTDGIRVRTRLDRKSCRLRLLVHMPDEHRVLRNFLMDLLTSLRALKVALGVIRSPRGGGGQPRGTWPQVFQVGFCRKLPGPGALRGHRTNGIGPPRPMLALLLGPVCLQVAQGSRAPGHSAATRIGLRPRPASAPTPGGQLPPYPTPKPSTAQTQGQSRYSSGLGARSEDLKATSVSDGSGSFTQLDRWLHGHPALLRKVQE